MQPTYLNPVYRHSCPDPFVLKHCGEYWCYFTRKEAGDRAFGILHSTDLVHWEYVSGALDPLPGDYPSYWAPEVTYQDGIFYLYYSVGNGEQMQIRVGTSTRPEGPFTDRGRQLTSERFAIDSHVFVDEDGAWYLFYATDYLEVARVGTGTAVDLMLDPFTLAGKPRPVTRARYDWQIFNPHRVEKGGVRWHTVEGPFVLKHGGRYYQMFSAGNWQDASYGVSYGVSDRLDSPGEWAQPCDGMETPPVLRSDPQRGVIGPGHNSVVRGPDNRQLYCVYHRWLLETRERVLAIDPLGWEGERLVVYGPSTATQPAPTPPLTAGFERFHVHSGFWQPVGNERQLISTGEPAKVVMEDLPQAFLLELSLRFAQPGGEIGLSMSGSQPEILRLSLDDDNNQARLEVGEALEARLPEGFDLQSFHLLRLEVAETSLSLSIDGPRLAWELPTRGVPLSLTLFSRNTAAEFAGLALSR
ncbi:MAG: glycoside hydrolase family 43 protein [Anaerolineaceae bacterium]|nr:glycoside hydrolase family 43 protein [Anaerolineaceae bacterium]